MATDLADNEEVMEDEQVLEEAHEKKSSIDKAEEELLNKYRSAFTEDEPAPEKDESPEEPAEEKPSKPAKASADEDSKTVSDDTDADYKRLSDLYGVSVDDLRKFSTPRDAESALRLRDEQLAREARQPTPPEPPAPPVKEEAKEEEVDWSGYDEDDPLVKGYKALQEKVKKVEDIEQLVLLQAQNAHYEKVIASQREGHRILDEMGLSELGKSDNLNEIQHQQRVNIFETTAALATQIASRTGKQPDMKSALERVVAFELKDSMDRREKDKLTEAVKKRQKQKLGSPGRKPGDVGPSKFDGEFEQTPELLDLYRELTS